MDAKQLNADVLSFVGDAVYGLKVREKLSSIPRKSGDLHALSVKFVNANAQCEAFEKIKDLLTEQELSIFKRGRNSHTSNTPKNSTKGQYQTATGIEALFGYLHISGDYGRIDELFNVIWEDFKENN